MNEIFHTNNNSSSHTETNYMNLVRLQKNAVRPTPPQKRNKGGANVGLNDWELDERNFQVYKDRKYKSKNECE